ncbi:hypothetical protein BU26DRAFT_503861 [Trematosphaeria pertusa]|uniref:Hydrophobin n=1 Tax=Trematosphaeria pertusa TaxID=390896 RepID=A0A6A6IPA1_9PLEO|nr:uncharacterized protein BU26DRAFT_503861 [Trematosphaeria pertusa]KAF2251333.1 hypothetical protein BU26DRAFT_503861 [Trematosphaeria pertusa]
MKPTLLAIASFISIAALAAPIPIGECIPGFSIGCKRAAADEPQLQLSEAKANPESGSDFAAPVVEFIVDAGVGREVAVEVAKRSPNPVAIGECIEGFSIGCKRGVGVGERQGVDERVEVEERSHGECIPGFSIGC